MSRECEVPFGRPAFPFSPPPFIQAHLYSFQRFGRRYRACAPTRPRPSAAWARSWERSREEARTATARVSRHKIIIFVFVEIFFAAVEGLEVARLRPRPASFETMLVVSSRSHLCDVNLPSSLMLPLFCRDGDVLKLNRLRLSLCTTPITLKH